MSDLVIFMLSVSFVCAYSEHLDSSVAPQGLQSSFTVSPLDSSGELQKFISDCLFSIMTQCLSQH